MPLYTVKCDDCEVETTVWRRVADRDSLPSCDKCNGVLHRVIVAPAISVDIQSYISPATGKVINSRKQMQYDLESSGNMVKEPGMEKDIARKKQEIADIKFKPIEAAVDAAVNNAVNRGLIGT